MSGRPAGLRGNGEDGRHDEGFYSAVLDQMTDGVYFVDRNRRITYWNAAATELTGFSREEVVGRQCRSGILNHVDDNGEELCGARCPLKATMVDGVRREVRVFMHHKYGHVQPVLVRAAPLRDADGVIVGAIETFSDDTDLMVIRRRLREAESLALMDPLTGLGNRRYLQRCFEQRLVDFHRHDVPFGLLIADVDRFKTVNDDFGHDVGDGVLRSLASSLTSACRADDVVTRLGGEEFAIVTGEITPSDLAALAQRARALVAASRFGPDAHPLRVTVSVGASMVRAGDTATTLQRRADQRLYRAKDSGRNLAVVTDIRPEPRLIA